MILPPLSKTDKKKDRGTDKVKVYMYFPSKDILELSFQFRCFYYNEICSNKARIL